MLAQVIQALWLLSTGLAASTYLMVGLALIPTVRRLPATTAWAFHRTFDPQVDRYMPASVAVGLVSGLAFLLTKPQLTASEGVLIGLACLGMATAAITSMAFNMQINRRLGRWTEAQVAEQEGAFWALRTSWGRGHLLRSTGAVLAFLIAVAICVF